MTIHRQHYTHNPVVLDPRTVTVQMMFAVIGAVNLIEFLSSRQLPSLMGAVVSMVAIWISWKRTVANAAASAVTNRSESADLAKDIQSLRVQISAIERDIKTLKNRPSH